MAEDNYKDPWWGDSVKFAEIFRKATGTNATYIEASASCIQVSLFSLVFTVTIAGVQFAVAALERAASLALVDINASLVYFLF